MPECCWNQEQIDPGGCPYVGPEEQQLLLDRRHRFLQRCLECPRFFEDLQHGPEELAAVVPFAVEEILALRARLQSQQGQLDARAQEIKFLHEVSLVLQTSVDMDEVIAMALTSVTAGQGFGFNRAVLLLVDRERQHLKGYFAVGPRSREDAARIWKELEGDDLTLREMAHLFFEKKMAAERERFRDLLEILSVPLARDDHPFVEALNHQQSRHILNLWQEPGLDHDQRQALDVRELVMVPLISKNRRIGLLLADNIVNDRHITGEDLQSLETFALPVAFAIERASLYERLQLELARANDANRRLHEQQELIVRMEKMALVGSIASNIAHSIRNPLMIIGGFARTLIRGTPPGDPKRQHIESIVREARRLEDVLQEVLTYSESLHPTLDWWDVNQLVTGVYAGLREELEMAGIDCAPDLAPGLPLARLDYKKVGYCLRTLISNSLEQLPRGGRLEIVTAASAGEVTVTVADNRPGPVPELPQDTGEPLQPTIADSTALGLSLCARILQAHHAHFAVAARQGGGTSFTIGLAKTEEESHDTSAGGR